MKFLSEDEGPSFEDFVKKAKEDLELYSHDHYAQTEDLRYPQTMLLFAIVEQLQKIAELLVPFYKSYQQADHDMINDLMAMPWIDVNKLDLEEEKGEE